jgi:hypothetical protein
MIIFADKFWRGSDKSRERGGGLTFEHAPFLTLPMAAVRKDLRFVFFA